MTDYVKITDFAAKDSFLTGNPAKLVKGAEIGAEFDELAIAVASKSDKSTTLSVAGGGTGATTLTGIVKGNGTSPFTAVAAPSGAIVGTTDSQTLTNKTIDGNSSTLLNATLDEHLSSVSGTNTITAAANAGITSYITGQSFRFIAAGENTGAVTVNVNSLGAKNLYKSGTLPLDLGDIVVGQSVSVVYDGTQFQFSSGAGGGGAKANNCIYENSTTITANYTLTTGKNGLSVGPITVDSGISLTIPSGARYVVL